MICSLLLSGRACLPLAAQEVEAPSASKPVTAQSRPADATTSGSGDDHGLKVRIGGRDSNSPTAAPAKTAAADEDHHGLKIEIGSSDTSLLTPEVRAQLSPEQIYKLELARLESDTLNEEVIIPVAFFALIFAIIGLVSWARFRRNRMTHETVRLLVEKGQPIPPEMFREHQKLPAPARTLQKGIIWTALGVGLTFFFMIGSGNWGIGLIPLCLGLGYLLTWKLESNSKPGTGA